MIVKYRLEKQDYYDFNLHHMSNFKKVNRSINIQRFSMPLVFTIIAGLTYMRGTASIGKIIPIYLVASIGWIVLYPKFLQKSIRKRLDAILKLESNKSLLEDKTLEVAEDGLYEILGEEEKRVLSSNEVVDIVETDKNIYIYLPGESAYIVPKKYLKDEEEKIEFIKAVEKLKIHSK